MASIGLTKIVRGTYDEVLAKVPDALKAEGFGVLTEIDVRDTLKKKLDVDFRRYRIVGACHPSLAFEALQAEPQVGLMMPCNVVVQEADGGKTVVLAMDPLTNSAAMSNPKLVTVLRSVKEKLEKVLARL